jgi:MFS family permease
VTKTVGSASRHPRVFHGWYVVAASFAILFVGAVGSSIIGVMVKPMEADLGWSRSAIASVVFLNMAMYAVSIIVTGRLYDRYGPKWVVALSTLFFSAGFALMATMHSLWEFSLYFGVLVGAGLGGVTVPMFGSIVSRWFNRRRGLFVSLAMAGFCLGQFLLIPVFSNMIEISGWRTTSLWIAGLCLVVNLTLTFGVIRGDPQKFGLRAYEGRGGLPLADATKSSSIVLGPSASGRDLTLSEAMRTRSLWLFTAAMFVCGGGDYFVMTHLVPMVTDYGISTGVAAQMLAWLGLLGLGGILLAGPVSDAVGNKIPIAATFALRVVLFIMVLEFKGTVPFWVFALGMGFTLPITAPLVPTLVSSLYGIGSIGLISGFITTAHMVGGGLLVYIGGVVFDKTGDYDVALIISAVLSGVALGCTLLIREHRHEVTAGDPVSSTASSI